MEQARSSREWARAGKKAVSEMRDWSTKEELNKNLEQMEQMITCSLKAN